MKARLCRRGGALLRDYCAESGIPFHNAGKLVVALNAVERARLDEIERRAHADGVSDVIRLTAAAMREKEPNVAGVEALYSPSTAMVDYTAVAKPQSTG